MTHFEWESGKYLIPFQIELLHGVQAVESAVHQEFY
jgi:hypothetical protein